MSTLIKNARILTMDDNFTEYSEGDILIRGTKIASIGRNVLPGEEDRKDLRVIDARGKLAMPGLVNGHLHSPGNFMKGVLDSFPLEIFMLYEVPPLIDTPPDPRHIYVRTMLSTMEMLKTGVTAVHDDAYYVPYPTPETIDGLMQSYADSGIRAVATIDQCNVVEYEKYPYLYDLLPPELRREMEEAPLSSESELLGYYKHLIENWNETFEGERIRAGCSVSAPQRVTESYFHELSELSKKHDIPLDIHMLETKLQRVLGQERYGKSLVQYVADLGVLSDQSMLIHSIWVDDDDIHRIIESGASVAHNPLCNLRLGSGIMQFRKIKDAGIPICLGSDEACSDDSVNMWLVGKVAGLVHNITGREYRDWPQAKEVLHALIRGGARAMYNHKRSGILESGYEADIILLDLNSLAFTPLNDVYRQLVYNELGSSVTMTMVAGKVVMEDGKLLSIDEEAIKEEAGEIMKSYRKDIAQIDDAAKKLEPYYRKMYFKAAENDVGMNRWASCEYS
ncbi:MAG: amidohydrolase family protein [Spirochaetaceae bacterium]|nr:amidohydrolase family protein [Spirochaetaceae bacterium]MCF7939788.1 amidohydrolase family protein [Spirochaetales bacterium]